MSLEEKAFLLVYGLCDLGTIFSSSLNRCPREDYPAINRFGTMSACAVSEGIRCPRRRENATRSVASFTDDFSGISTCSDSDPVGRKNAFLCHRHFRHHFTSFLGSHDRDLISEDQPALLNRRFQCKPELIPQSTNCSFYQQRVVLTLLASSR